MTSSIARPGLSLPTPPRGVGVGGVGGEGREERQAEQEEWDGHVIMAWQGESENTVGGGGRHERGDTNTSSSVPLVKAGESE